MDTDMEVLQDIDGQLPGTSSLKGYTRLYRQQQQTQIPGIDLMLCSYQAILPEANIDKIMARLTQLQTGVSETNLQMYQKIHEFIGPDL
jgi:hypothetical protein